MREQQAVFYHAQLATLTPDELRARYPTEAKNIKRFLRMGEMRKVIRGLHYDDKDLEEFVKSSQLSMSSLEYAYAKPKIQQALGRKAVDEAIRKASFDLVVLGATLSRNDRHHLPYMVKKVSTETKVLVMHADGSRHPYVDACTDTGASLESVLNHIEGMKIPGATQAAAAAAGR